MNTSPETTAIELIDQILEKMLDQDQQARVIAFLADKYAKVEPVPDWTGDSGSVPRGVDHSGLSVSSGWGWGSHA